MHSSVGVSAFSCFSLRPPPPATPKTDGSSFLKTQSNLVNGDLEGVPYHARLSIYKMGREGGVLPIERRAGHDPVHRAFHREKFFTVVITEAVSEQGLAQLSAQDKARCFLFIEKLTLQKRPVSDARRIF